MLFRSVSQSRYCRGVAVSVGVLVLVGVCDGVYVSVAVGVLVSVGVLVLVGVFDGV